MIVSILLSAILALLTFYYCKKTVLPTMLKRILDTPFRYCYTSTLWRYVSVVTVYCFLFITVIWGSAYIVSNIVWTYLPESGVSRQSWAAMWLPLLVLGVYGLCCLPGLRNFIIGFHWHILRHLLFPILPSTKEDSAITQLLRATETIAADEVANVGLPDSIDGKVREQIERQIHSIVVMHNQLVQLFNGHGNHLRLPLYREEWSLAHSLYQAIFTQLHKHPAQLTPDLINTIQLCQYYCCHLLVCYWFGTTFSDEQRQNKFQQLATHR